MCLYISNQLKILDQEDRLIAWIAGDLPLLLKQQLEVSLSSAFARSNGPILVELDTRTAENTELAEVPTYKSIHFSYYARNGPQVRRLKVRSQIETD